MEWTDAATRDLVLPAHSGRVSLVGLQRLRTIVDALLQRLPAAEEKDDAQDPIDPAQLRRRAFIYVRQSTQTQVQRNHESTRRQYELADRAIALGWSPDQVEIIDEDLGCSGASSAERIGFARLTAEVALGRAGIVLGLKASRLARNNADWYRLLDLCGLTDTLIGDADGIYHPRRHNDRLVLAFLCTALHKG